MLVCRQMLLLALLLKLGTAEVLIHLRRREFVAQQKEPALFNAAAHAVKQLQILFAAVIMQRHHGNRTVIAFRLQLIFKEITTNRADALLVLRQIFRNFREQLRSFDAQGDDRLFVHFLFPFLFQMFLLHVLFRFWI